MSRFLLIGALLSAAVVALIWSQQRRLVYFPLATVPPPGELQLTGVEEVNFHTSDGLTLHGWFFSASDAPMPWTVSYSTGTAATARIARP